MAVTIIADAGHTDSNCYCTLEDANIYFDTRLHKDSWTGAGSEDKKRALIWATRLLDDSLVWKGYKTNYEQSLRWPREDIFDQDGNWVTDVEIPDFLRNATAELAMFLIAEDRTLETNRDLLGFKRMKVDVIEFETDPWTKKPVLPNSVWTMIRWYTVDPRQMTLVRA